ncbi:hypothetical protein ACYOEI_28500 [Singulisphaera rosea]
MSTAGKVLVVLVLLVLPIWIILVASVANLNTEWTMALKKLEGNIKTLEKQVADNEAMSHGLKDQIALAQSTAETNHVVIRSKLAEIERARAETTQIKTAVDVQLDTLKAALASAESTREHRKTEAQEEEKAKGAALADVERLKGETNQLMDQLSKLREEFKSTLDANRKLVERLLRGGSTPPARSASLLSPVTR